MYKRSNEVVAIKDLFARYRTVLKAPQKSVETASLQVINRLTKFNLKEGQVSYTVTSRTLYIKTSSLIKQELGFFHEEILIDLERSLGKKNCPRKIL